MKSIFRICIPAVSLLAVVASAQQHYKITDLKPLPGGNFSQAFSVNNIGLMGGQSNITDATQRAVLWVKGWTTPILIGPAGVNSAMFGINESGRARSNRNFRTRTQTPRIFAATVPTADAFLSAGTTMS
jgi:hypothetical protein